MTFTENSALVKMWVRNVQNGNYLKEQVPDLFNLREIVYTAL